MQEFFFFVLLPMAWGLVLAVVAPIVAWTTRPLGWWAVQMVTLVPVLGAIAWCEMVLWNIARGAWPTFLPHLLLILVTLVVAVQCAINVRCRPGDPGEWPAD